MRVSDFRAGEFYLKDFKTMLKLKDIGVFVRVGSRYVGYGWLKLKSSKDYYFTLDEAYLCRFFVHPDFRGMNIYPCSIAYLLDIAKRKGLRKAYISAAPSNIASLRGMEKMGFEFLKEIKFVRCCKCTLNKYKL